MRIWKGIGYLPFNKKIEHLKIKTEIFLTGVNEELLQVLHKQMNYVLLLSEETILDDLCTSVFTILS